MSDQADKVDPSRRIAVVEPDPDVGRWLVRLIKGVARAEPIGPFTALDEFTSSELAGGVDTLLLDLQSLRAFIPKLIAEVKYINPNIKVILMDYDDGPSRARMAARLGADGWAAKDRVVEEIIRPWGAGPRKPADEG